MNNHRLPGTRHIDRELRESDRGHVAYATAPVTATPALFVAGIAVGFALAEAIGEKQPQ
ncbi:hypothetical protein [Streptomyces abyssomicinicus]|uniref:hypothetical protein n=1 Tax=Streptomyces abyssomicinicus TaxID=574929 RepID=UPI0013DF81DB|nr:hypothetical protein [Streptomyces abyssomicinicus]